MLHRNKSFYLEQKLVQESKNPKELQKSFACFGLNAKEWNKANVSLNKDGRIQFKLFKSNPQENANIFKTL